MKHFQSQSARILDEAAKDVKPIEQLSIEHSFTLEDAYLIQKESLDHRYSRGEQLIGIKLGFTSRAKMQQMGVNELIWGRLTDKMQLLSGGELKRSNHIHPRVEPEIAFMIKEDISEPIELKDVREKIEAITVAAEIIDSRYENFKFSLEDVIADNCSSSAFVIGEWLSPECSVSDLSMSLRINGDSVQSGNSNAILGNPLESIVEASNILSKYGQHLEKGMILLAGAATPAEFFNQGDHVEVECESLGKVEFKAV